MSGITTDREQEIEANLDVIAATVHASIGRRLRSSFVSDMKVGDLVRMAAQKGVRLEVRMTAPAVDLRSRK